MQGRLSPRVDGKIQAFPWNSWQQEFLKAQELGLTLMEWTLDQDRLGENPLMTESGRREILDLSRRHHVRVGSLTGDCFMQAPFYKVSGEQQTVLVRDFFNIIHACSQLGLRYIVFPLVDAGRLENLQQEETFKNIFQDAFGTLREKNVAVVFESDFEPRRLKTFLEFFPSDIVGLNYDIGNSASLGFDPDLEFASIGNRILNVHIKDRLKGGTTVPLGTGNADFKKVFAGLKKLQYKGDYILQTARAENSDHSGVLAKYKKMTEDFLARSGEGL